MSSEEEGAVAWLRQRIRERLYLARHAIELGNAAEWTELSSGVLMTIAPDAPQDRWDGVHPMGDSSLSRLMEANDPQDTIARCEAELAILDLHESVPVAGWEDNRPIFRWQECQECGPNNDQSGVYAVPGEGEAFYPCSTIRLLASGYKHRPGFPAALAAA